MKNEVISMKKLDFVSGGTIIETLEDMDAFTDGTGHRFIGSRAERLKEFDEIIKKCGLKFKNHFTDPNEYYLLDAKGNVGKQISRKEAIKIAIANHKEE